MKRIGEKGKSMYRAALRAGLTLAITFLLGAACPAPKVTESKNDKGPLTSKKKSDAADKSPSETAKKKDCSGWAVYGPPPCHADEDCVKREGEGWYCNTEHYYTDPCGEKHPWPLCQPKPDQPKKDEPKKDK
jgi:hypothetical protein